jgi:hypothetical protein
MACERNPLFITIGDKYEVRRFASQRGVDCAPLLHVTQDANTIPFASLPPDCMIKATHASGWNIARINSAFCLFGDGCGPIRDELPAHESRNHALVPMSQEEVVAQCNRWIASRYRLLEWAYQRMTPRIVVEAALCPRQGHELFDFRLYTFRGEVRAINVGSASFRRHRLNVFLAPDWSPIPLTRYVESLPERIPQRPDTLPEMIDIAKRLGQDLDFVRIDLYDTTVGVVLGEMTPYPNGGLRGMPSGCPRLDLWLGSQWPMGRAARCSAIALNAVEWMLAPLLDAVRWTGRAFGGMVGRTRRSTGS